MTNKSPLYPLKFEPILKERLWGGVKLGRLLDKPITNDNTGESWEVSAVPGDISVVSNGPLRGTDLRQLIEKYGEDLLGADVVNRFGNVFPVLIKFIDAAKDLSIQLHPNDELARKRHNSFGKTEMWHVLDADDGANLIIGFNREVTKKEYKSSLESDGLQDLLHYEPVKKGDTFMVNAGRLHAIGAGVLLAEIQQTSDITYRVFDFNRRDKNGNLRELHTDLALDAIDYSAKQDFKVNYHEVPGHASEMVRTPYFITSYLKLEESTRLMLSDRSSFSIYVCVAGDAVLESGENKLTLKLGETVLIPASVPFIEIKTSGITMLEVTI